MTNHEQLEAICVELGLDVGQGYAYLDRMFGETEWECDIDAVYKGIAKGKGKFQQFVRACIRVGLLEKVQVVRFAKDTTLRVYMLDQVGEPAFETVEQAEERQQLKATSIMEWYEKAEEMRKQLWFPDIARRMLDLFINEATNHEREWSAVVNEFYAPMLSLQERDFPQDVVYAALSITVGKNIWNPMYALAICKSEMKRRESADKKLIGTTNNDSFVLDDGRVCSRYDTWCLRDDRYRQQYISAFGDPDA